jgi:hypothetical protein
MAALPRPTKGFSSARAQKWVLAAAILEMLIYTFRHLIEGDTSSAPASSSQARAFLGQGKPPNFGQWIIAYGVAFTFLGVLTLGAPEVAGALAMFMLVATFLESGGQLATDLSQIEHGVGGATASSSTAAVGETGAQITQQALTQGKTIATPAGTGSEFAGYHLVKLPDGNVTAVKNS